MDPESRTMKPMRTLLASTPLLFAATALAGPIEMMPAPEPVADPFATVRRPMTNPTLFDLALPRTQVHGIFMHHRFPDEIDTALGRVPFGGDLQLYALQLEYAFHERFSFVALKDGYVDFNPDHTFGNGNGWANLAGGFKWAYLYQPENQFVASASLFYEFPTGSDEVFQGDGDGNLILTTQAVKLLGAWQFAGGAGVQVPIDDEFSKQWFVSAHVSYETCPWFIPFVEANWFHVFDQGDGGVRYRSQLDGLVPGVAPGEGADLLNWGATMSNDYVSLGTGFRTRFTDCFSVGLAYEVALTAEEDNVTDDRFTFDFVLTF